MPSKSSSIYLFSFVAAVIAAILAIGPPWRYLFFDENSTYCYDSITTLSKNVKTANCFSISSSGTFSRVFQRNADDPPRNVIQSSGAVIPGLWDGHGHILGYGELLNTVNLFGASSLTESLAKIKDYLSDHPSVGSASDWIRGIGWDQAAFGRMPTAADLETDEALKGKFIMLSRVDSHCIWVSKAVLDLLQSPIPQVPGGEVITDPGLGVFCDNAMDMVISKWPYPDEEKRITFVKSAMRELNKVGLVGVHDASVVPSTLKSLEDLADSNDLTVRIYAMLECEKRNTFCPESVKKISRSDGLLEARSVKLFADGALGSWGSAMIQPYSDHPHSTGSLLVNSSVLTALTKSWALAGYQVNIHAIGDLANRLVVDAFSAAYPYLCPDESPSECQSRHRFRIEHAQIIHLDDQKRIFELGIIPSIQPTHATSDMAYAEDRLGQIRTTEEAYRMRSFLPLQPSLGSDFPVEPPNPFQGIFSAVTRRSPKTGLGKNGSKSGWYTEESLDLNKALHGFTTGPARAAFLEGKAGIIEEGSFADWVVLDQPLEDMSIDDLRTLRVRETWVGGRLVFQRSKP